MARIDTLIAVRMCLLTLGRIQLRAWALHRHRCVTIACICNQPNALYTPPPAICTAPAFPACPRRIHRYTPPPHPPRTIPLSRSTSLTPFPFLTLPPQGIMVRHYAKKELSGYVRVSVGKPEHTDALVEALKTI